MLLSLLEVISNFFDIVSDFIHLFLLSNTYA